MIDFVPNFAVILKKENGSETTLFASFAYEEALTFYDDKMEEYRDKYKSKEIDANDQIKLIDLRKECVVKSFKLLELL